MAEKTDKRKTIALDELTVGEILLYGRLDFCRERENFLKYGNNLRACWKRIFYHHSNFYDQLCKSIGLYVYAPLADAVAKDAMKYLKKTVDRQIVREKVRAFFETDWFKKEEDITQKMEDEEYERLMHQLLAHLNKMAEINNDLGVRFVATKSTTKKKNNNAKSSQDQKQRDR